MVRTITAKMPQSGKRFETNTTTTVVQPKPKRNYGDMLLNLFGFISDIAVKR
jgi:hypothetical protein